MLTIVGGTMAAGWRKFTGASQYPELTHNQDYSSFCYGVKADRKFRLPWIQGKRDYDLEHDVINWIETITRKFAPNEKDVAEWLKDGTILCEVLEIVMPGSLLRRVTTRKSQFSAAENVTNFLDSAKAGGVDDFWLFELSDLLDEKDIGRVFRTLAHLKENLKKRNVTIQRL
uniref:Calponin-homology (CH) domain-containing protein n=1 Tax=Panagrellus redivivus TaxID=6233 RepID=A0A7E4VLB7_PANRE